MNTKAADKCAAFFILIEWQACRKEKNYLYDGTEQQATSNEWIFEHKLSSMYYTNLRYVVNKIPLRVRNQSGSRARFQFLS